MAATELAPNIVIGTRIVSLNRQWNNYEADRARKRGYTPLRVIDFDVAPAVLPKTPPDKVLDTPVRSREEVEEKLARLRELTVNIAPGGVYARSKIEAEQAYLNALRRYRTERNQPFKPAEYYAEILPGVNLRRNPENKIAAEFAPLEEAFLRACHQKGINTRGLKLNQQNWELFYEAAKFASTNQLTNEYSKARRRLLPIMKRALGMQLRPRYKAEVVEEDATFVAWADGIRGNLRLRINGHKDVLGRHFEGNEQYFVCHEEEHMLEAWGWQRSYDTGKNDNPLYCQTTIKGGVEQFGLEGRAVVFALLVPELYDALDDNGKFAARFAYYRQLVMANVHRMVQEFEDPTEITAYINSKLVGETSARIAKHIKNRRHPEQAPYQLSYEEGSRVTMELLSPLPEQLRLKILAELAERPRTPIEIKSLIVMRTNGHYQPAA